MKDTPNIAVGIIPCTHDSCSYRNDVGNVEIIRSDYSYAVFDSTTQKITRSYDLGGLSRVLVKTHGPNCIDDLTFDSPEDLTTFKKPWGYDGSIEFNPLSVKEKSDLRELIAVYSKESIK